MFPSDIISLYTLVCQEYFGFVKAISTMPIKTRSAYVKCCQAQAIPENKHSALGSMLYTSPSYWISPNPYYSDNIQFASIHSRLFTSSVLAPITLDLLRSIEMSDQDIKQAFNDSIWKEIECCEGVEERRGLINWSPFFHNQWDQSILAQLPPNPYMTKLVHRCLTNWRTNESHKIHFPRSSHKTMAHSTRNVIKQLGFPELGDDDSLWVSQKTWLWIYSHKGLAIPGPSEMRYKWYPSGMKPRTYYAMGGTHFSASCLLQDAFTRLVNTNRMTHHITRLQPTLVRLNAGQHLKIYDFTSFTSRMDVQKDFIFHLAEFCVGWDFWAFDVKDGLVHFDFGEVLLRYWQTCCVKPEVTYERVSSKIQQQPRDESSNHMIASMLGIYGNLMSCTFAHAIVISQAVDDEDQNATAGDDGNIAEDEDNAHYIECAACSLGIFEPSKNFDTSQPPCISLKRPIAQLPGSSTLVSKPCPIPPSFVLIRKVIDPLYHDIRYMEYERPPPPVLCSQLGKACFRYLRSCYFSQDRLSDGDISYALDLVYNITRAVSKHHDISLDGRLPLCVSSHRIFWPLVDRSLESFRLRDPANQLLNRWFNGYIFTTLRGVMNSEYHYVEGSCFRSNSSTWLSLMVDLGYYRMEIVEQVLYDSVAYNHAVRYFTEPEPVVYDVTCIQSVPEHLMFPVLI